MLRKLERAKPKSSNRVIRSSRRRFLYQTLIVMIGLAGAKPNAAARAAPPTNETIDHFDISISPIPNPACAKTSYDVEYFASVDTVTDLNGSQVNLEGGPGPSEIAVRATSSDTSVAEFHPETLTATALDGRIGKGAKFLLRTEAPGSATLTMTGKIQWARERIIFPPLQQPIKVINCKFKITIHSITAGFIPNITETGVYTLTGELGGDANAALVGDADVSWKTQQVSSCFTTKQAVPDSTATLEGSLSEDGDRLTVHVTFGQVMLFNSVNFICGFGAAANAQHQFQPPPIDFTVPTTGGSASQPVTLIISEIVESGTAIITVVPLEAH